MGGSLVAAPPRCVSVVRSQDIARERVSAPRDHLYFFRSRGGWGSRPYESFSMIMPSLRWITKSD